METKTALGIGVVAGLVSAMFPSIPTIYKFEYWKESWFLIYTGICLLILIGIAVWCLK